MNAPTSLMAAEIAEAGEAVARGLAHNADGLRAFVERLRRHDPSVVATIARGSSDHCALYLKYLVEIALGIPCASMGPSIASLYNAPLKLSHALAVSISQSGRSPDIVEMQRAAKRAGALTLAFVNDEASPLARDPDCLAPLRAGTERSVAATKSVIAGLAAGAALVATWSDDRELLEALGELPRILSNQIAPPPDEMICWIAQVRSAFILGRGASFAIAAEAALKLKETCGIHAEAFSSAEVLHGPAGIIGPGFPVIAFLPGDEARAGMIDTLKRIGEMGARLLVVDAGGDDSTDRLAVADAGHPRMTPISMIHRFYRVAEAASRRLGRDPDHPQHLRKVTETR